MHPTEVAENDSTGKHTSIQRIALVGNPNSGKTSVFNQLTGLRQKVGNFPGVTVEKKSGSFFLPDGREITLIDFPGTYSLHPNSSDERVVSNAFCSPEAPDFPDAVLYVVDIMQLEQQLLLFTQLLDIGLPLVLLLNMADQADTKGSERLCKDLKRRFEVPVLTISARSGDGFGEVKETIQQLKKTKRSGFRFYEVSEVEEQVIEVVQKNRSGLSDYQALLVAHHLKWLPGWQNENKEELQSSIKEIGFDSLHFQVRETMSRFDRFTPWLREEKLAAASRSGSWSAKIDQYLTHRWIGPIIFALIMFLVFQAIFSWATYPMDLIDNGLSLLGDWVQQVLPAAWYTDLITDGILAGLGGVLIFIPQIAILFFLVSILEEVGYMARAVFLFDRLMQRFGLNGRSIVALISGGACAIPAVMSARTIANPRERLITILVTPFISCSARIPVYTVLIGFVVPPVIVGKVFNLQGLAFMGLYLLGIFAALGSAWIFKKILKSKEPGYLLMELPIYRPPVFRNVFLTVFEKVKAFTVEAGKIIFAISIILWVLATYGPTKQMELARQEAQEVAVANGLEEGEANDLLASKELEASYAGIIGKTIEPVIRPLGFDWKIGIALFTSFAAREVFVSTMATIYSIGSEGNEYRIRDRLAAEKDPVTGQPVYTLATSLSLLIFYVLAMQCMSTLAVVKRETQSWKWPIFQFVYMTGLAYLGSLLIYQGFQFFG